MINLFHVKRGEIIVIEKNDAFSFSVGKLKMMVCFDTVVDMHSTYYFCSSIFVIGWSGLFYANGRFSADLSVSHVRKPTPAEMFQIGDVLRQHGYRYNRKTKQLTKINVG
jgi:hypothetical protein